MRWSVLNFGIFVRLSECTHAARDFLFGLRVLVCELNSQESMLPCASIYMYIYIYIWLFSVCSGVIFHGDAISEHRAEQWRYALNS